MNNISARFSDWDYRNIALAAVTQCAVLVHELAVSGRVDERKMRSCVEPLLEMNPDSVEELYPRISDFSDGISVLQQSFDSEGMRKHAEVVRYVLGMLTIQQKIAKDPARQAAIGKGLQELKNSLQGSEDTVISMTSCSDISHLYQATISKLSHRVHVSGNPQHLRQQHVANQIRTLLFAGIRSAVLWHQLGGRRWHLFFYKKRIRQNLTEIRRKLLAVNTIDAGRSSADDADQ